MPAGILACLNGGIRNIPGRQVIPPGLGPTVVDFARPPPAGRVEAINGLVRHEGYRRYSEYALEHARLKKLDWVVCQLAQYLPVGPLRIPNVLDLRCGTGN